MVYVVYTHRSHAVLTCTQRLKAALHHSVGKICAEVEGTEFSREVIAAVTEAAFNQSQLLAWDMEAFAKLVKAPQNPPLHTSFFLSSLPFHPPLFPSSSLPLSLPPFYSARHAKRTVVAPEDVRLCCRRNNDLLTYMTEQLEKLRAVRETRKTAAAERGEKGEKGERGESGEKGERGKSGETGERAETREEAETVPKKRKNTKKRRLDDDDV